MRDHKDNGGSLRDQTGSAVQRGTGSDVKEPVGSPSAL
jgi:hypothetical protein